MGAIACCVACRTYKEEFPLSIGIHIRAVVPQKQHFVHSAQSRESFEMRSKLPSFIDVVVDGENHFELRRPNKEDKAGVMYYLVEDRKTHQLRQGMKQTIESIKDDTDRTWHNVLHDDTWCAWKLTRTGFDDLVLGIVVFSWHGMFPRSVKGGKEKSSCEDIAPAADDEFSHAMVALGTGRAQSHWCE